MLEFADVAAFLSYLEPVLLKMEKEEAKKTQI
jgi:hypothetical protein